MEISLRGLVYDRYKTIDAFAQKMNWSRSKASLIVSGKQRPGASDMEKMADALKITDRKTFMTLFFPELSTK